MMYIAQCVEEFIVDVYVSRLV